MNKLPDTPLLLSGGLGGPAVIFVSTPLRNAMTLGSQDCKSGIRQLYGKVFRGGPRAGWTGGIFPAIAACPQFLCLGPVYHLLNNNVQELVGISGARGNASRSWSASILAACGTGLVETLLIFGSQSRNAQMAYNKSFVQFSSLTEGSRSTLRLNKIYRVWGPGAGAMTLRNILAITSVRVLSPWLQEHGPQGFVPAGGRAVLCDISAAIFGSILTAPINQLFNFIATSPDAAYMSWQKKCTLSRTFLRKQYFVPMLREDAFSVDLTREPMQQRYSWRLTSVAMRDLTMRATYISVIFGGFMSIERTMCALMRGS